MKTSIAFENSSSNAEEKEKQLKQESTLNMGKEDTVKRESSHLDQSIRDLVEERRFLSEDRDFSFTNKIDLVEDESIQSSEQTLQCNRKTSLQQKIIQYATATTV